MALLVLLIPDVTYYFPSIRSGLILKIPLAYALALLPTLFWIVFIERSRFVLDDVSTRMWFVAIADWLATLVPAAVCAAIIWLGGHDIYYATARNVIFFALLAIFGFSISRHYLGFVLPTLYLLGSCAFGFPYGAATPDGWAFVVDSWKPDRDWNLTLVAFVIASVTFVVRQGRR